MDSNLCSMGGCGREAVTPEMKITDPHSDWETDPFVLCQKCKDIFIRNAKQRSEGY